MSYSDVKVVVGEFFLAPGIGDGRIWIGRDSGPSAGEGGDFRIEDVEKLLREFYEENF